MKILMVNHMFTNFGGGETMLMAQANLLKAHGHNIEFFALDKEPYFIKDYKYSKYFPHIKSGIKNYLRHPIKYYYNGDVKNALKKTIEEIKPNLIHCQFIDTFTYSIFDCFKDIPTILTIHSPYRVFCPIGTYMNNERICKNGCEKGNYIPCIKNNCSHNIEGNTRKALYSYIAFKNFKNVDYYITPSEALKKQVIFSKIIEDSNNIISIPNFLDRDMYNTVPNYNNRGYFLYAGRLVKHKGVQYLLQAMKELPRNIEIHIAGTGEFESELKHYKNEYNLNNVKFLGHLTREQLFNEYQNCIATLVASNWFEIFGLVNIESFINGKPVIASNIGGIPEIVEHNVNGLLFEPANIDQLKNCIMTYWNNPELVVQHGKNGYQKARNNYSEDRYYEQIIKIYQHVINKYKEKM